ncbi:MAG: YheT family hydrolase [Burkholderiales bacterium]
MKSSYRAPWWLPGGNAQTLYAALIANAGPMPRFRRVRWETPDQDFIDIDWLNGDADAPLMVVFHGLEGNSSSHYSRALAHGFSRRGWRVAVAHFRGCSGEPNRLVRAYHSGDSAEIGWILSRFKRESSQAVAAIGISLGGNALLKYLGECGDAARAVLGAAVSVSAPLDLMVAGDALGRGFARVYSKVFLRTLKEKYESKALRFPRAFDLACMRRSGSLREFDNAVTAPLHGFRDTDDYWTRASAKPSLRSIIVPTLLLNARNDPFLPAHALPGKDEVSTFVECEFPETGGHVGFVGGFPGGFVWFVDRIIGFIERHVYSPGG